MLNRYNKSTIKDNYYYNLLLNKKIAIVGPSCNTLGTKQKNLIESYDLVVRLNKTFEIPENLQEDIGVRTDILYNSLNTDDFPGENDLNRNKIHNLKDKGLKIISSPYPFIYPFDKDIIKFLDNNQSMLPYHIIDITLYKYLISILKIRPYTGTSAIADLISYPIKELYITGIDCYLNKYYTEYRKINKRNLLRLRNNHIHKNKPQLAFLKQLSLNDNRIKLDKFLENYFFEKEYKIYRKLSSSDNYFKNINNSYINNKIKNKINKLTNNKFILYSFKNVMRENIFIINNSFNYSNLNLYSDCYININNNNVNSNFQINNDIKLLLDFNNNLNILKLIQKNTDIQNIIIINSDIFKDIINYKIFDKFNILFVNIYLLICLFNKLIYIDKDILKNLTTLEKTILHYFQHLSKIKIIQL